MRIIHLVKDLSGRGNGIINTVVDIAAEQAGRGHTVVVCSRGGDYVPLLESRGVEHYQIDQRAGCHLISVALFKLIRFTRTFKPDVVHGHMVASVGLAFAAKMFVGYPLVSHLHNVHQRSSALMRLGDRVIAVSQGVADSPVGRGIPAKKLRIVVSGSLGSCRVRSPGAYRPVELVQPAIVTVAGMNHRKGIAELISAFQVVAREHPETRLYLVGDGPDREVFEQQAAASEAATRITFVGFVANPLPYMMAADIFVLASRRESLGLVLIEARECGCAIVATNVDGIPEALEYGQRGILTPPSNVEALAGAISSLLTNRSKHKQLKISAAQNLDVFTVKRMVDEVMMVYRELVGGQWQLRTAKSL